MSKNLSVAEVKATLSECLRDVERGESLLITRHGKPVAALVRVEDLEHLERLRSAGPEGGLASLAGGWEGSDELVQLIGTSRRLSRREVPSLD
jgi:prevent-host-death family protein